MKKKPAGWLGLPCQWWCQSHHTGQVRVLAGARLVLRRLDDLLQRLVVDIRRRPLRDLIVRKVLTELHVEEPKTREEKKDDK